MTKAYINPQSCIRCDDCKAAKACPLKAIFRISAEEPNFVNPTFCRGCGDCIARCGAKAVVLKEG